MYTFGTELSNEAKVLSISVDCCPILEEIRVLKSLRKR